MRNELGFRVLAAVLIILGCGGCGPRVTVSRDTTYFTEPLRPDGAVDYVAALNQLYGAGVTPENNAAVPLVAILGESVPESVARRMGLQDASQPTERFLGGISDWSDYVDWRRESGRPFQGPDASDQLSAELIAAMALPWSARDYPLVAQWLEDMKGPLDAIGQAARRSRYWIPLTEPLPSSFIPSLLMRRNVGNALRARAMLRLYGEDPEGAAEDVVTILRFGSLQSRSPALIDQLIAIAITNMATEALPLVAAHPKLSREGIQQTLSKLGGLEPFPPPSEKIGNMERALMLESVLDTAYRGEYAPDSSSDIELGFLERKLVNWDEVLRMINQCYDAEIACQEAVTPQARRAACSERDRLLSKDKKADDVRAALKDGASPTEKMMIVFRITASIALPSLSRANVSFNEMNALKRLGTLALVLRAYQTEKGGFPERLESLSASDLYGLSTAAQAHGYRFSFYPGAAARKSTQQAVGATADYAYTAIPEEQGISGVRSFCIDSIGVLVTLDDGSEPPVRKGRCVSS